MQNRYPFYLNILEHAYFATLNYLEILYMQVLNLSVISLHVQYFHLFKKLINL